MFAWSAETRDSFKAGGAKLAPVSPWNSCYYPDFRSLTVNLNCQDDKFLFDLL